MGGFRTTLWSQVFTANGSWSSSWLAWLPAVYTWGPAGNGAPGQNATHSGGGGAGGSFDGEPALGGVGPNTLTITVPAAGSGNPTTVTGGSVTVSAPAGGNAVGVAGGAAGAAGTNTIAEAGGAGGNGLSAASRGGGGGGGSGGSTGPGGAGGTGGAPTGGTAGTAGTGAAAPPISLAGAAGGVGGAATGPAGAGTAPGGAGGGGGDSGARPAGTSQPGQAAIVWYTFTLTADMPPRRPPSRAVSGGQAGSPTPAVAVTLGTANKQPPAGQQLTIIRRGQSRGQAGSPTPAGPPPTPGTANKQPPPSGNRPRPVIRGVSRGQAGSPTPVAPPKPPPSPIPGDQVTNSGGDRGVAVRVFRSIMPGDVPSSGAQLPRLQGRSLAVPIPSDVEHAGHAWEVLEEPPPVLEGPGLLEQLEGAAGQALERLKAAGPWTLEMTGEMFAALELPRKPVQRTCGKVHRLGGTRLVCGRRPGHQGKHSDRGLDWRLCAPASSAPVSRPAIVRPATGHSRASALSMPIARGPGRTVVAWTLRPCAGRTENPATR